MQQDRLSCVFYRNAAKGAGLGAIHGKSLKYSLAGFYKLGAAWVGARIYKIELAGLFSGILAAVA